MASTAKLTPTAPEGDLREFRAFLRRMCRQFASNRAFAMAIGMEASSLSRAMGPAGMAFDVVRCLRIAKVTRQNPIDVLRLARKDEVADLLEELFGRSDRVLLQPEQAALLQAFDVIGDDDTRRALVQLARVAARLRPHPLTAAPGRRRPARAGRQEERSTR